MFKGVHQLDQWFHWKNSVRKDKQTWDLRISSIDPGPSASCILFWNKKNIKKNRTSKRLIQMQKVSRTNDLFVIMGEDCIEDTNSIPLSKSRDVYRQNKTDPADNRSHNLCLNKKSSNIIIYFAQFYSSSSLTISTYHFLSHPFHHIETLLSEFESTSPLVTHSSAKPSFQWYCSRKQCKCVQGV